MFIIYRTEKENLMLKKKIGFIIKINFFKKKFSKFCSFTRPVIKY